MKYNLTSIILIIIAFIGLSFLSGRLLESLSSQAVLVGPFGALLFLAMLVFDSIVVAPVSTVPLMPIATGLWGVVPTALLSIAGWTIGSMIAFAIARRFGRPYVERVIGRDGFQKMERYVPKEHLFLNVVFLRMILPVDLLSYALGTLSNMRILHYFLATVIGVTPFAFVFSYAATLPLTYQIVGGVLVVILVIILNSLRLRRHSKKTSGK